jgi:hypothetical protein
MALAAQRLQRAEVEERVRGLLDGDMYGVRAVLASVLPDEHVTGDGAAR